MKGHFHLNKNLNPYKEIKSPGKQNHMANIKASVNIFSVFNYMFPPVLFKRQLHNAIIRILFW